MRLGRSERANAIRRALADLGEGVEVVRDKRGALVGVVVPSGHPLFGDAVGVLYGLNGRDGRGSGVEGLEVLEFVRWFVADEFFVTRGRCTTYTLLELDVVWGVFGCWVGSLPVCERRVVERGELEGALVDLGFSVSGGYVRGLVLKGQVLSDGLVEAGNG